MSRAPAEWNGGAWVMGNRELFLTYAASGALPRWLRVVFAGYGVVAANGHANFRQGELCVLLGDQVDGVHVPTERQRVREAIDVAVDRGLLLEGSKALCLVVPRNAISYGSGNADARCRRHPDSGKER